MVRSLNLRATAAGADCALPVSLLLKATRSLETLDLSSNAFGDGGVRMIAEAALGPAAAQGTLTDLDLSGTGAGVLAATAITRLVREGGQLRRLGLADLRLPQAAWAEALLPALLLAPRLVAVNLSNNGVGPAGGAALAALLRGAPCLEACDITGWALDAAAFKGVASAMISPGCHVSVLVTSVAQGKLLLGALRGLRNTPAGRLLKQLPPRRVAMRAGGVSELADEELDVDLVTGPASRPSSAAAAAAAASRSGRRMKTSSSTSPPSAFAWKAKRSVLRLSASTSPKPHCDSSWAAHTRASGRMLSL